jgi:hypothetical protein
MMKSAMLHSFMGLHGCFSSDRKHLRQTASETHLGVFTRSVNKITTFSMDVYWTRCRSRCPMSPRGHTVMNMIHGRPSSRGCG